MKKMKGKLIFIFAGIGIFVYLLSTSFFCLDETQTGIICQFGKPVRILKEPGLKLKMPLPIQMKILFDKRLLLYELVPSEFLTSDKQNIVVGVCVCWRIKEPLKFFQAVGTRKKMELRLEDLVRAELGATLGNSPFSTLISYGEQMELRNIFEEITNNCNRKAMEHYGVEISGVMIEQLGFPEENMPSIFARMRAERKRIAQKYRAEGKEEAAKIEAEAKKQKQIILSEAYRKAEEIKGEGDAKASKIYGKAFSKDPKFYEFIRTLQAYDKFLDTKTVIILPGDSKLLKLLEKGKEE